MRCTIRKTLFSSALVICIWAFVAFVNHFDGQRPKDVDSAILEKQQRYFPNQINMANGLGPNKVNITYEILPKNKRQTHIIADWPPSKDRYMPHYIQPNKNTFFLQPALSKSTGCKLLVAVTSRVESFRQRQSARQTWASDLGPEVCVIFMIGKTDSHLVQEEASTYHDLLQADMEDTYNNLGLKSVFMLKFFHDLPSENKPLYLLKTDEDVFVNLPQLLNILESPEVKESSHFILGYRHGSTKRLVPVIKDRKNKWGVPNYMFNGRVYPVYVSGRGYLMSKEAAHCLYQSALNLPYFFLEDVFVTGFAAENCRIPRYHCTGFQVELENLNDVKETDVLVHGYRFDYLQRIFQ